VILLFFCRLLGLCLLFTGSILASSNGLISDALIKPPDFFTLSPPAAVGASYVDPVFNTRITRVTNCGMAGSQVLGGYMGNSEICTFNSDGSFFIATENVVENGVEVNATFLYSGSTGGRLKRLGKDTIRPWWIRWALADRYKKNGQYVLFDPKHHFYKYEGNEIRLYDVRNMDSWVTLRRFSEYQSIGPAGGEGDLSDDGRYWCLDGDGRELFVYDLIDDIKHPASTFNAGVIGSPGSELGVDYAAISPLGRYVVVSWSTTPQEARYHGIEVYDRQFNFQRQIYPGIIHWELGVDSYGHEVLYNTAGFAVSEFFTSRGVQPGDIISIRLSDGYIRLLHHMPSWASQIMSGCNSVTDHKYVYVAFYGRSSDPDKLWSPYWGEIVEIPTDGSGAVRRLVHHRSRAVAGKSEKYWQPDLVVNRQGTMVVYRSTYLAPTGDLYLFAVGNRDAVPADETPPRPPIGLSSPSQTFDAIQLVWERSAQATDGDFASFYRLYRDDALICEIVDTHYTDTAVREATRYRYDVYAVDKAGLTSPSSATLEVSTRADVIPPTIVYASVLDRSRLTVKFSEPVEKSSAESLANFTLQPDLSVRSALLSADALTVTLNCDEMQMGVVYRLAIQNIRDISRAGNLLPAGATVDLRLLSDFIDDFSNGLTDAWSPLNPQRWRVAKNEGDDALNLFDEAYDSPDGKRLGEYLLLQPSRFYGREFTVRYSARSTENMLENRYADHAILFSYQDSLNYYYVQFHPYDVVLTRIQNGEKEVLSKITSSVQLDQSISVLVRVQWDTCTVTLNQQTVLRYAIPQRPDGQIGLGSYNDTCFFDDFSVEAFYKKDTIAPAAPKGLTVFPLIP